MTVAVVSAEPSRDTHYRNLPGVIQLLGYPGKHCCTQCLPVQALSSHCLSQFHVVVWMFDILGHLPKYLAYYSSIHAERQPQVILRSHQPIKTSATFELQVLKKLVEVLHYLFLLRNKNQSEGIGFHRNTFA
jgi:hypothetical protein